MNTNSKPQRVVAYMRVACKNQLSLEQQRAELQKYAKEKGYEIVSFIADNGVSGLKNKKAVKKILHEAKKHDCDMAVCKDPSRLSRDPKLMMLIQDKLRKRNVRMDYVLAPTQANADYLAMQLHCQRLLDHSEKKATKWRR